MRNVSHKSHKKKFETHILCSKTFFKNLDIYEIMWKNSVDLDRPQITTWGLHTACRITTATNTIFDYVILIAFTLQPQLHKCTSMLYDTYIACLVIVKFQLQILSSVHPKSLCFHYKPCICIFS